MSTFHHFPVNLNGAMWILILKLIISTGTCDAAPHSQGKAWPYPSNRLYGQKAAGRALTNATLVISIGFPKAGTTSLYEFFKCNNVSAVAHFGCRHGSHSCGHCFERFVTNTASKHLKKNASYYEQMLFEQCGHYSVFANNMYLTNQDCLYPAVDHIRQIQATLPRACFILHTRDLQKWVESYFHYGAMYNRAIKNCQGVWPRTKEGIVEWHRIHLENARQVLSKHDCAIEYDIEDPAAGETLASYFHGARSECWGHYNRGSNKTKPVP